MEAFNELHAKAKSGGGNTESFKRLTILIPGVKEKSFAGNLASMGFKRRFGELIYKNTDIHAYIIGEDDGSIIRIVCPDKTEMLETYNVALKIIGRIAGEDYDLKKVYIFMDYEVDSTMFAGRMRASINALKIKTIESMSCCIDYEDSKGYYMMHLKIEGKQASITFVEDMDYTETHDAFDVFVKSAEQRIREIKMGWGDERAR